MPSRCLLNLARERRWSCFKENVLNQSNKRESEPGGHCVCVAAEIVPDRPNRRGEHQQGGAGAGRASLAFRTQYFFSPGFVLPALAFARQKTPPCPPGLGSAGPPVSALLLLCVCARACLLVCVCVY